MPYAIGETNLCLDISDVTTEMALLSLRSEELSLTLEKMRLENSMTVAQRQYEQEAEMRRHKEEIEKLRMQFEEDRNVREHADKMRRLEMEANNKSREHELKPEVQETLRLKVELAKATENTEKLRNEDYRRARDNRERMAAIEVERLKSAEEIRQQRLDERRIVTEEKQEQISELSNRCEQLERQCRKEEEQEIRSLRNLGLVATGVGAASGAIGGAFGSTAAVGLAAGVVGAATVLAPVSGTVAILTGAGYVYKIATSSNRA